MPEKRVVVTGLGIISPIGTGREAFFRGFSQGSCGIKPISLFDASIYKVKNAGEVTDFAPESILGPKGLRTLDRSTRLVTSAAKLAMEDAGLEVSGDNALDIGVAIGSTMGSIKSISDFDKDALLEGPRYVNPALFPNTVINSPASQVSIRFGIRGFNATISSGYTAGLDAINYAADFIRLGRINAALAGGVEELCEQIFAGFYHAGCIGHDNVSLGEGSTILVLEEMGLAKSRGAKILAEIKGYATAFGKDALARVMKQAIKVSGIALEDIGCVISAAGSAETGIIEAEAVKDVFAKYAQNVYISAIKPLAGEQYSNSGSTAAACALCAIDKSISRPACGNVLVNAFGKSGSVSSMVISGI